MKIIEYISVESNDTVKFMDTINKFIGLGWQPFGSLQAVVNPIGNQLVTVQAMVRYES